jgi:Transposase, Mutator family
LASGESPRLEQLDPGWVVAGNAGVTRRMRIVLRLVDPHGGSTSDDLPMQVASLDENFLILKVIGLDVGECETETFWRAFLRSLIERGLAGVELVISDAHAGLKRAIAQVLGCPWQRSSVHFLREALGHARREQQPMLAALLRPLFNADSGEAARELLGGALERLRTPLPKVAALIEEAKTERRHASSPRSERPTALPTRYG